MISDNWIWKSNIFVQKKRALRVFAKVFEWEFESVPMGGSQRCQDCCQSLTHYCTTHLPTVTHYCTTYLPTYLRWKHPNILTDPFPLGQFLHLLPTPLWMTRLLSRQRVCLFQPGWDFWEGGSAVFGTIGPFYESQHPLQAPAPSLLSAHFQRLCLCCWWLWSPRWE